MNKMTKQDWSGIVPHKSQWLLVGLVTLGLNACLDPKIDEVRVDHQDARVPSNLCLNVQCPASEDPCTEDGVCDPGTGECVFAQRQNGDFCDDGNLCTEGERCQDGECTNGNAVVCQPIDQCHDAGTCIPETGCTTPLKPVGTNCGDGNPCTLNDQCNENGECVGAAKDCSATSDCYEDGVCNSATGECTTPKSADGKRCTGPDTEDLCLIGACLDGGCVLVDLVRDE